MNDDSLNGSQCLDGAIGLLRQYSTSNEVSQLDEAIRLLKVAAGLMPNGYPDLPNTYAALVGAYTQRFIRLNNVDDREKARLAVAEGVRRLDFAPAAAPIWSNLASLTRVIYQQTGNLTDLNESIDAARTAARAWIESGAAIHPMTHATVAGSVMTRFALQQHVEDLSETLEYADAAVDAAGPGHPDRLSVLAMSKKVHISALSP